jgi:hypothetical protein
MIELEHYIIELDECEIAALLAATEEAVTAYRELNVLTEASVNLFSAVQKLLVAFGTEPPTDD